MMCYFNTEGRCQPAKHFMVRLSFNFSKKKEVGIKTITLGDKTIVEGVV